MKRFILTAVVLAALSAAAWRFRQQELETLRAEAIGAREQRAQTDFSRKEIAAEPAEKIDAQEVARLRALLPELARLRGSIGALRARTNQTPEQLQAQAQKVREEATLIRARFDAREKSKAAKGAIGTCLMLVTGLAVNTDGALPQTWDEVRSRLSQTNPGEARVMDHLRRMFEQASTPEGVIADFEIIPSPSDVRIKRRGPRGQIPLLRERRARPQPDGGFARYYAWLDGRTEEALAKNENFTVWESENLKADVANVAGQ
jgi:hypothetical protein